MNSTPRRRVLALGSSGGVSSMELHFWAMFLQYFWRKRRNFLHHVPMCAPCLVNTGYRLCYVITVQSVYNGWHRSLREVYHLISGGETYKAAF